MTLVVETNIEKLKNTVKHLEEFAKDDPSWNSNILAINYGIDKLGEKYEG